MPDEWTDAELKACVEDWLELLEAQLRGEPRTKATFT